MVPQSASTVRIVNSLVNKDEAFKEQLHWVGDYDLAFFAKVRLLQQAWRAKSFCTASSGQHRSIGMSIRAVQSPRPLCLPAACCQMSHAPHMVVMSQMYVRRSRQWGMPHIASSERRAPVRRRAAGTRMHSAASGQHRYNITCTA